MTQMSEIEGVQLFVKAMTLTMLRAEYDALPDRQELTALPVDGVRYRDSAHPGLVFRCHCGPNWARYGFDAFSATLT